MTAEIAIINRTAVALAADSAVTLTGHGGPDKIYNSADKIFELSHHDPLGLMVYNNLQFMGMPLDVAIKHFRESAKGKKCKTITEAANHFFDFLINDIGTTPAAEQQHAKQVAALLFRRIFNIFLSRMADLARTNPKKPPKGFDPFKLFDDVTGNFINELRKIKPADCFAKVKLETISDTFKVSFVEVVNDVFKNFFIELKNSQKNALVNIASLFIHRDLYSSLETGLVFSGYAGTDLLPSIISFRIDGAICGVLKKQSAKKVTIDRSDVVAEILPFAQREMVDRFLYGIDPEFETEIPTYLENTLRKTGISIIEDSVSKQIKKDDLKKKLEGSIKVALDEFRQSALDVIKKGYERDIRDIVSLMPKQELANFAESLVNITSIKRKVSAEQETVGGPIDVAVISRTDGFVWVKRKHYFDSALNPRYFARKFGTATPPQKGARS